MATYTLNCGHIYVLKDAVRMAISDGDAKCMSCNKRLTSREGCYLAFANVEGGETVEQFEKRVMNSRCKQHSILKEFLEIDVLEAIDRVYEEEGYIDYDKHIELVLDIVIND